MHSLLWQIVKNGTMKRATEKLQYTFPTSQTKLDTCRAEEGEQIVESSLVRWINMTLGWTDTKEAITDLQRSLVDGIVYGKLLDSLFPEHFDGQAFWALSTSHERAQAIVETGRKILGARCILEVKDISRANETMNTLFLASLCRLMTDEAGSVAPLSRRSSVASSLVVGDEEAETALGERITELERKNEELCRRLDNVTIFKEATVDATIQFDEREEFQSGIDMAISAPSLGGITHQPASSHNDISMVDITPKSSSDRQSSKKSCTASEGTPSVLSVISGPLVTLLQDSVRLHRIYEHSKDLKPLLRAIYEGDLSAYRLAESATLTGTITKRGGWRMRWRSRFAVIKDNFILFYRDTAAAQPKEVERLDGCLVKIVEDVTSVRKKDYPVLSVEVSSKVDPHYFYISADAESIKFWRAAISRTSTWWNMKRFE